VLRQLWDAVPALGGEVEDLAVVTSEWADVVGERMNRLKPGYDPGLVEEGVRLLRALPESTLRTVGLHGDFNPGNVLSDGQGWLAIDPKPMNGDPAYDPWPLLEQVDDPFAHSSPARVLRERLALVAEELSLDAERITAWAIARRVETALWAADLGDLSGGADVMGEVRVLADLI
jgi:streptomycin 6-kinase